MWTISHISFPFLNLNMHVLPVDFKKKTEASSHTHFYNQINGIKTIGPKELLPRFRT